MSRDYRNNMQDDALEIVLQKFDNEGDNNAYHFAIKSINNMTNYEFLGLLDDILNAR